ncbi:thiosulfate dehydrogenase [quinone] large subunit [Scopulibacillus daqui]|uniref:Thiosulfate dehydrogenase [quinone] large subunit n=1 Tax=Scopulibacillus daqui TaxID=1469162 RepID=A0ABS2PZR9_9BACL|nr:DoxX family membrane protein [Scopulibacillus daqui]MBM7644944.1 thiosulfate dehydrogenase [quinone] large subunit [Scopulibacillus daqui]
MAKFLWKKAYFSYILTFLRLYLGLQWIQVGWRNIAGDFDITDFLVSAVKRTSDGHSSLQVIWGDLLQSFAIPHIDLFNLVLPWVEFFIGIGLILGCLTSILAFIGLIMNLMHMLFAGSAPFQMVLIEIILLIAPYVRKQACLIKGTVKFIRQTDKG